MELWAVALAAAAVFSVLEQEENRIGNVPTAAKVSINFFFRFWRLIMEKNLPLMMAIAIGQSSDLLIAEKRRYGTA